MQPQNIAKYVKELMPADELRAFVSANDQQRRAMAVARLDEHLKQVRNAIVDDRNWSAAVRQICLDYMGQAGGVSVQSPQVVTPPRREALPSRLRTPALPAR